MTVSCPLFYIFSIFIFFPLCALLHGLPVSTISFSKFKIKIKQRKADVCNYKKCLFFCTHSSHRVLAEKQSNLGLFHCDLKIGSRNKKSQSCVSSLVGALPQKEEPLSEKIQFMAYKIFEIYKLFNEDLNFYSINMKIFTHQVAYGYHRRLS